VNEIHQEFLVLPSSTDFMRVSLQLVIAAALGGVLGFEREREGKDAGLRTHMLVALGAALFVIASVEAGMAIADISRVFQGIVTGIGFLGAGTILKLTDQKQIQA
jgi:putative Mg2+ transporter-C (MgtC) family protein